MWVCVSPYVNLCVGVSPYIVCVWVCHHILSVCDCVHICVCLHIMVCSTWVSFQWKQFVDITCICVPFHLCVCHHGGCNTLLTTVMSFVGLILCELVLGQKCVNFIFGES